MSVLQKTIPVALGNRSYPIHIGDGLIQQLDLLGEELKARQILLVSNDTVAPLYAEAILKQLPETTQKFILADGESEKNLASATQLYDKLLSEKFNRDCCLIALGGGVIGDLTGFVAATYQRGVDFIQIPTTLLSQVDASVGGKTAVNHPLGKNMIGAFHQPQAVLIDTQTLNTLPQREFLAGLSEVIKYGLLGDAGFLDWIESNLSRLLKKDPTALIEAISRSCENKAAIVAADETERSGQRARLNLGHTFGHAIETAQGYGQWLHGEAVATGMCMAADLSWREGWLTVGEKDRAIQLIKDAGLPTRTPTNMTTDDFMEHMSVDKKVASGRLRLILMQGLGHSLQTDAYSDSNLTATLDKYCSHAN